MLARYSLSQEERRVPRGGLHEERAEPPVHHVVLETENSKVISIRGASYHRSGGDAVVDGDGCAGDAFGFV